MSREHLDEDLTGRVMAHYPLPVADAFGALAAAQNPNQRRDLLVEAFRACIRFVGAVALAARAQYGPGPGPQSKEAARLLTKLRGRGLTDGEWVGLCRELLKPWRGNPDEHVLPALVRLFCKDKTFAKQLDTLLALRKQATVAHGTTGSEAEAREMLGERLPAFEGLLEKLEPLLREARLLVPLERVADDRQQARLLMGCTPPRRWWRSVTLAEGERRPPGEVVLADAEGKPCVALAPVALFRPPSPGAPEMIMRPQSMSEKAVTRAKRTPFLSATWPRKNMAMVMPAVSTITMWWAGMSGLSTPRNTKPENCMAR